MPVISSVRPADEESALGPLVLAFANDPAMRWMYPDAHQFRLFFPRFVRALAGKAFAHGTARRIEGFRGTALWLAPGVGIDDQALVPLLHETVAAQRRAEVIALFARISAHSPAGPHWYLPLIGIDPHHQSEGLGSMLIQKMLTVIEDSDVPVHLAATNVRNVPFYERHGFRRCGEIQVGSSPLLFAMCRDPR